MRIWKVDAEALSLQFVVLRKITGPVISGTVPSSGRRMTSMVLWTRRDAERRTRVLMSPGRDITAADCEVVVDDAGAQRRLTWQPGTRSHTLPPTCSMYTVSYDHQPLAFSDIINLVNVRFIYISWPKQLTTVGRRTFPVAASLVWNSIPSDIQASSSLSAFRQRLKTFLFSPVFSWHCALITLRPRGLRNSFVILATLKILDWHWQNKRKPSW